MLSLLLAAMLVASPTPVPTPLVTVVPPLSRTQVAADGAIVQASIPCNILIYESGLKGKAKVTDGLGKLWGASLRLHAVMEHQRRFTQREFLEATADVMACVDWSAGK